MILPGLLSVLIFLIVTCIGGIILLYFYFQKQYKYWSDRNVEHAKPVFPFGNLIGLRDNSIHVVFKKIYEQAKDHRYYGFWQFHRPCLMINDPELIKNILVGDFMSFHDHGAYVNEEKDPLAGNWNEFKIKFSFVLFFLIIFRFFFFFSANLFTLEGAAWRNLRVKLTPIFTSGKLKMMFPIMVECGKELQEVLMEFARVGDVVDIKEYSARFATDIISSTAFGIEAHSLKNPNAIVRQMGRKVFEPTWNIMLRNLASFFVPDVARLLKVTFS